MNRVAARRPGGPRRTVARSKVVSLVAAVALVTLAAIGYQLSEPHDFQVVRGQLGTFGTYDHGSLRVDHVQIGTEFAPSTQQAVSTPGVFVMVRVTVRASGGTEVTANHVRLLAEGTSYAPRTLTSTVTAAAGFENSDDVGFEVAPDRLAGLTLEVWRTQGFVTGYEQRVRVPLGVTAANAAQWREAAQGRQVSPEAAAPARGLR